MEGPGSEARVVPSHGEFVSVQALPVDMSTKQSCRLAIAFVGCGNLGTAVVTGLLLAQSRIRDDLRLTEVMICNRSKRDTSAFRRHIPEGSRVQIMTTDTAVGVRRAEVIFLACPPDQVTAVLELEGVKDSLQGKLLISLLGGVSQSTLDEAVHREGSPAGQRRRCCIMRATTNIAARAGKAVTLVCEKTPACTASGPAFELGVRILGLLGTTIVVPEAQMRVGTALAASGTAFFALILEAAVDGAVGLGLPHDAATQMAAQTMLGVGTLALDTHPALIRREVTTPGGSTERGLASLESAAVRSAFGRALQMTVEAHKS